MAPLAKCRALGDLSHIPRGHGGAWGARGRMIQEAPQGEEPAGGGTGELQSGDKASFVRASFVFILLFNLF